MLRAQWVQPHRGMSKPQPKPIPARSAAEALRQAVLCHQRGQLGEAETLYRYTLDSDPDNFDALHLYGVLKHQRGNHADALSFIARALKPDFAEALNNRGNALRALKRLQEALTSFDRAVAVRADYAEALNNRGNSLVDLGRLEDALESYDRALAHRPKYVDALINRANTLRLLGRHDEALASFERAVLFKPDHAEGYLGHGNTLLTLKRLAEAVHSNDRAIALAPTAVDAF